MHEQPGPDRQVWLENDWISSSRASRLLEFYRHLLALALTLIGKSYLPTEVQDTFPNGKNNTVHLNLFCEGLQKLVGDFSKRKKIIMLVLIELYLNMKIFF